MPVRIVEDPRDYTEFADRVEPFLLRDEAVHNLLFGILAGLRFSPDPASPDGGGPVLASVEGPDGVEAVAIMTPPRNLVVSRSATVGALDDLARGLHRHGLALPGVSGPAAEAHVFAAAWRQLTSRPAHRMFAMQIYQATAIRPPEPVAPGRLRPAEPADLPLVVRWISDFNAEALNQRPSTEEAWRLAERLVLRADPQRSLFIWEDQAPVTMTATGGPTPNGQRVFAVYTPPPQRRKGYASACVARVSQALLEGGRRYCFLFTDTANPTSNHIYRQLGYQPVAPFDDYRFGEDPSRS